MFRRFRQSGAYAAILVAILVVVVAIGAAFVPYRGDLLQERERIARGSQVVATPCGQIEYADTGTGTPVLTIHGAGGGFDQGLDIVAPLAAHGLRIIAVSRFGYLRTPMPRDASPEAQARAHACLMDALGIEKAGVVGASAGAPSALQFALQFPQRTRALVLLVPAVYVPREGNAPSVTMPSGTHALFNSALKSDFLLWAGIHVAPRSLTRALLATPPAVMDSASAEEKQRVSTVLRHVLPVTRRREGLINDAAVTSNSRRYPLETISVPTLLVSAEDDLFGTYDSARYTASQIPGARFVGFKTGGHMLVGHQAEATSEMLAFLR